MLLALAACQGKDATRAVAPTEQLVGSAAIYAQVQKAIAGRPGITAEQFNAKNRMGWVGRTHNRFLEQVRSELRSEHNPTACSVVRHVLSRGAFWSEDSVRVGAADRRQLADAALASSACASTGGERNIRSEGAKSQLPRLTPVRRKLKRILLAQPYLDAIASAIASASNSTDLATVAQGIVDAAAADASLSSDDVDIVSAGASIAASSVASAESYFSSSQADADSYQFDSCISAASALTQCVQPVNRRVPTFASRPIIQFASFAVRTSCLGTFSISEAGRVDFAGLSGGFTASGFNPGAAGVTAATASSLDMFWQLGRYAWCRLK